MDMDNRLDDLVDNENFYKIIDPYIESGMLTEIYASNYISVFNFSNKIYVTCLHMVLNDSIVGHIATESFIKKEIEDNLQAFEIQETSGIIFPRSCYLFNKERFGYWQKYITNINKCYTDPKFDEEIMKKYPRESANENGSAQQYSDVQPQPRHTDHESGAEPTISPDEYPQWLGYTGPESGVKPAVFYIIAGVMAALQVLMFFLPHLAYKSEVFVPVEIFGGADFLEKIGASGAFNDVGGFMFFFVLLLALEIVWAIMSFMKKRPAGIFGIVASALGFFVHMSWLLDISGATLVHGASLTPCPLFMLLFSIAGIPVSIVQIVKKNYL